MDRAPRHSVIVNFPQHSERCWAVLEEDHVKVEKERDQLRAEVEALRKDKERLDSGCIMTHERDDFGLAYKSERRGLDLRAAIDDAIHARQSQEVET